MIKLGKECKKTEEIEAAPPECLPESQPRYAGEVQEIKIKGVVVKARRAIYSSRRQDVIWGTWENY